MNISTHAAQAILEAQKKHEDGGYFEIEELLDIVLGAEITKDSRITTGTILHTQSNRFSFVEVSDDSADHFYVCHSECGKEFKIFHTSPKTGLPVTLSHSVLGNIY